MANVDEPEKSESAISILPVFAGFILSNKLEVFVEEQLRLSRELDLPLLKHFSSFSPDELFNLSIQRTTEFLNHFINGTVDEQIRSSRLRYIGDRLEYVSRDQVQAEDITGVSYVRKQALIKFIPDFTTDLQQAIALIKEIDDYILKSETIYTETYLDLMQLRIDQIEKEAGEKNELYKQAQALAHIGNWTWIIRENKILWTDELYRIYGLEPQSETISFERFASFIHPDDKEYLFNSIQQCLLTKEPYDLHHRIILSDGTIKHMNAKGSYQPAWEGRPEQMVGTGQDVTLQVNTEEQLRQSHHFIQTIADATPALIASYNVKTGMYTFMSGGIRKLLGYDASEPMQEGVGFFVRRVHPDDLPKIIEKNDATLAQANANGPTDREPVFEFEYRVMDAHGTYRWFQTYGTIFDRNAEGEVEHVLNISIDITERKEMETALSMKNTQLQQSNANLEEFAYVASHDLKEPLRKISIFGDRLLSTQYPHLGPEGQLYLEKIIDSSRRMQVLINDLLSLSLISGNQPFVHYSIQSIFEDVLRLLEHKIEEKDVSIEAPPLPEARVIPFQFRQLLQNLLSNSMKFVRPGVKPLIRVSYRWVKFDEVAELRMQYASRYLEMTISDNGIGFENAYSGKIFSIFQRLNNRDFEGTGIGLAICKKIVENHGGVIYAKGEPGKGAEFRFVIPGG